MTFDDFDAQIQAEDFYNEQDHVTEQDLADMAEAWADDLDHQDYDDDDDDRETDYGDVMDGDHESALGSAGFGLDETYGGWDMDYGYDD